jgi:hypothetical protein
MVFITQKVAVTVIADGKSKYTGMKILRYWLALVLNGDTINP